MREVNQPSKDLGHSLDVTHKEKKNESQKIPGFWPEHLDKSCATDQVRDQQRKSGLLSEELC